MHVKLREHEENKKRNPMSYGAAMLLRIIYDLKGKYSENSYLAHSLVEAKRKTQNINV
jgi:hypothetical protein